MVEKSCQCPEDNPGLPVSFFIPFFYAASEVSKAFKKPLNRLIFCKYLFWRGSD